MTMMTKQGAIAYIKKTGLSSDAAEYMVRDFPDSFSMGDAGIPDHVYDIIIDGMVEVMFEVDEE